MRTINRIYRCKRIGNRGVRKERMSIHRVIKTILFDFGGVLAEEGFREGLQCIGKKSGLDPDTFFSAADSLIFETGYLTGISDEAAFWNAVRKRTGIQGADTDLRQEILERFVLRPEMIATVDCLRAGGIRVAMLSDQTNWLEEIAGRTGLFEHFDRVFNSFLMHKSKRDASTFSDACRELGVAPEEALFIDDNLNHIGRAKSTGLATIHFTTFDDFKRQLRNHISCCCG
jgi:putative hydrolase of the HAD superfamily